MKFIIEKNQDGHIYCYRETEKHFKKAERSRQDHGLIQAKLELLDEECDLSHYDKGIYFVVNL